MNEQDLHPAPAASGQPRAFCRKCGYALVGLPSRCCPECGRTFDPANPRTFARRPPRGWIWRWGRHIALLMLAVMLLAGLGLGWVWWEWRSEQKGIASLRALNLPEKPRNPLIVFKPIGPKWLEDLLGQRLGYLRDRVSGISFGYGRSAKLESLDFGSFGHLKNLNLSYATINADILATVGDARRLEYLSLGHGLHEKPNLTCLARLPNLITLHLEGPEIGNNQLAQISTLNHLKYLYLNNCQITDAGLKHLQGLTSLEDLGIPNIRITDASLEQLKDMKSLRYLYAPSKSISRKGIDKLKAAIPGLIVNTFPE